MLALNIRRVSKMVTHNKDGASWYQN